MIWIPLATMKLAVNTSPAPTTDSGSARKTEASLGEHASIAQNPATASAITRLVAPLAWDMPTRLGALPMPTTPRPPPMKHPMPSASTPPWIVFRSGRFQSASLIR